MLVRVESPGSKLGGGMVVLELVGRHGRTADWIVRKRSITSVNATATVVGGTDPPRVARFRLLAFGVLGMDRRNGGLSLSLRGSFSYSRTSSRNGAFAHRGLTWSGPLPSRRFVSCFGRRLVLGMTRSEKVEWYEN